MHTTLKQIDANSLNKNVHFNKNASH